MNKNNLAQIEKVLANKKIKKVALLAPSFLTDFSYPQIIYQLKKLGFNKVVEVTFGAKMINREYHKALERSQEKILIATTCPGIIETIKSKFPQYANNLAQIDSPMTAMGKICKKNYKGYKTIFISPCHFKKIESEKSAFIDFVVDYQQLQQLFEKYKISSEKINCKGLCFDKFYNDYTKIYPLSGGLTKTAHLKNIIKKSQCKTIDGWLAVQKFLEKPNKKIKFLDCTFCKGGCIGGPCTNSKISLWRKTRRIKKYLRQAERESIPENRKGIIKKATGINFLKRV